MQFYIMKDNNKFQGQYKTQAAAESGIAMCEKYSHSGLTIKCFKPPIVAKRQFKTENGKRFVLSKVSKLHVYHIECAPSDAVESWCKTEKSCCAKCHEPLYKNPIL